MATTNSSIVTTIYQEIAGGFAPPAADLTVYTAQMTNNGWTPAQVATAIEGESFIQNVVDPIIREYQAAFGRVPDQAGLNYWISVVAPKGPTGAINTAAFNSLSTIFVNSAEFQSRYGASFTATTVVNTSNGGALVTALYTNVLGRAPDASGLNFWLNAGLTTQQLLQAFSQSTEFVSDTNSAIAAFENAEASGTPITTGSLLNLATSDGQTFTLTTGVDTLPGLIGSLGTTSTAGNDKIVGTLNFDTSSDLDLTHSTLNAGDSINGGGGTDTLSVILASQDSGYIGQDVYLTGITVTNVENLLVNDSGNGLDDDLYLPTNTFHSVTLENIYDSSIYGVNEGTATTVLVGPQNDGDYDDGYIDNEIFFAATTASSVTMNDTLQGNAAESNGESHYAYFYHGDEGAGLSNATTINATLNLLNAHTASNESDYAYQYIYADNAGNVGANITANMNVTNATSDGTEYSEAGTYIYQNGDATVTANINVSNSADVWAEVDAQENGTIAASAHNVANITLANVTGTYGDTGVGAYGFDTVNISITGSATLDDGLFFDEYNTTATDANSQTVTITASANLTADETELDYYGSTATKVSGAGNVNLGDYYASSSSVLSATVTATVDASAMTGNLTIDVQGPIQSVKGGSGNDTILLEDVSTFGSVPKGGLALDGGTGSNTVGFTGAGWATIAGGSSANLAHITNFQTLEITNLGSLAANNTYDLSTLSGLVSFIANNGVDSTYTATVSHLGAGSTVTEQGDLTNVTPGVLALQLTTDTAADTTHLVLNGDYADNNNTTVDTYSNYAAVDASLIETVSINSTGSDTSAFSPSAGYKADVVNNTLTLTDTALKTLTVTGDQGLTLHLADTALTSLNASGMTVSVATNLGVSVNDTNVLAAAATFTGTGGADTFSLANQTKAMTVNSGAGNDTIITGSGADVITTGTGNSTVTSGAGLDLVTFGTGNNTFVESKNVNGNTYAALTGMNVGDTISLTNVVHGTDTFSATQVTLASTAAFADYLDAATAGDGSTNSATHWFVYGGNTFIVTDNNAASTFQNSATTGDQVVELVGTVSLAHATYASHVVTIA